jgi:hypothetical protein
VRRLAQYIVSREEAVADGDVAVSRSGGLDTVCVKFPAGVDLEERASRMNRFWDALVEFQFHDVVLVALCTRR